MLQASPSRMHAHLPAAWLPTLSLLTALLGSCTPAPEAQSAHDGTSGEAPGNVADSPSAVGTSTGEQGTAVPSNAVRLYVGSGDWGTATGAVSVFNFDINDGTLTRVSHVEAGGLLSFLATDSGSSVLYAADEGQNKLRSFAIDADTGSLSPLATADTIQGMVYVNVTSNDKYILGAEFNSGKTEVFGLDGKGGFSAQVSVVDSGGESHGVFLAPDERFALVPGRASDQVQVFTFDANAGALARHGAVQLPKGAGCRHLDFHPNGNFVYLINEFANTIVAFTYDSQAGTLTELQTISTQPDTAKSSAADIHVHPSGKFLYGTNRPAGANGSIVAYSIGDDGKLTFLQKESTEGQVPRNFELIDDGKRIVVGNQESKSLVSFAVDPDSGRLTRQGVTPVEVKPFFVGAL